MILLFSACSTTQKFYDNGTFGEQKLSKDTYRISFYGGSNHQRAQNMLFLRFSELALKNGYSYFIVQNGSWRKEEIKMNFILTISEKYTVTGQVKFLHAPIQGQYQVYDAKAIYENRLKEINRDISSEK